MKKITKLFLSAILFSSLLVGCSDDTSSSTTSSSTTIESNETNETPNATADDNEVTSSTSDALVVAMELAYPPFEMKDMDGNPTGVSVDLANAFGEFVGREIIIENTAWDGLIPSIVTGNADMIISSMSVTEERSEIVDFSTPYANSILAIVANVDSEVESVEDFNSADLTMAVKLGSTGHLYAEKNLPDVNLTVLTDESACLTEVVQGKADGFIYGQDSIIAALESYPDDTKAIFIPAYNAEPWGIAVQKDNSELLDQLNDFIPQFRADGGFDELTEKYLAERKASFDELGFLWYFDVQ